MNSCWNACGPCSARQNGGAHRDRANRSVGELALRTRVRAELQAPDSVVASALDLQKLCAPAWQPQWTLPALIQDLPAGAGKMRDCVEQG